MNLAPVAATPEEAIDSAAEVAELLRAGSPSVSRSPPPLRLPITEWAAEVRRVEELGFDEVVIADHFTDGYDTEPMVGLTAAAITTGRLRLRPAVLGVDYRHPVLVHRMAATLDVVSEGRLTLGMGGGG